MITYLGLIVSRAFAGAVLFTDKLAILAGVLTPAFFQASGEAMPEWVAGYIAWAIIITVAGGILLRLLTAPYFIWREQNSRIAKLEHELASPERQMKEKITDYLADCRLDFVNEIFRVQEMALSTSTKDPTDLLAFQTNERIQRLLKELAFDEELMARWGALSDEISSVIHDRPDPANFTSIQERTKKELEHHDSIGPRVAPKIQAVVRRLQLHD